jgi:hypothetical protein
MISLVHFDPIFGRFEKFESYAKECMFPEIFSDPEEPSNFVLEYINPENPERSICIGNVIGTKIEFGKTLSVGGFSHDYIYSFAENQVRYVNFPFIEDDRDFNHVSFCFIFHINLTF